MATRREGGSVLASCRDSAGLEPFIGTPVVAVTALSSPAPSSPVAHHAHLDHRDEERPDSAASAPSAGRVARTAEYMPGEKLAEATMLSHSLRNHSIVFGNPSAKRVFGSYPSSSRARSTEARMRLFVSHFLRSANTTPA